MKTKITKTLFISSLMLMSWGNTSNAQIITTIAGRGYFGSSGYSGDGGLATNADLDDPGTVFLDASGNVYISDVWSFRIRKVDASTGIITTIAGNGTQGYSGDGGLATNAEISWSGAFPDASGNIYISDFGNNRIRKIDALTGIITTIGGNGTMDGYDTVRNGALATGIPLYEPGGICTDASGNVYFGDGFHAIRKIDASTGIITLIVGGGTGGLGDGGPAINARLNNPGGIFTDAAGNIYIADSGNNRIRKISASTSIINTIAGTGTPGFSGDGGPATNAELHSPQGVFADASGNVYFSDAINQRVRKISAATGIITTIAGNGFQSPDGPPYGGYSGDGGPAISAELSEPSGLFVDVPGNVYIADALNSRIRKVSVTTTGIAENTPPNEIGIYPNPSKGIFTVSLQNKAADCTLEVYSVLGAKVFGKLINDPQTSTEIDLSGYPKGIYFLKINEGNTKYAVERLIIQ